MQSLPSAVVQHAVVDSVTGAVVNVVLWDDTAQWSPPPGTTAIKDAAVQAAIGGTWSGGTFAKPSAKVT